MRIPANYLKKVVDKISMDALFKHHHKKAENFLQSVHSRAPWVILGGAAVAVFAAKKLDIGPKAGKEGGEIISCGSLEDLLNNPSWILDDLLDRRDRPNNWVLHVPV